MGGTSGKGGEVMVDHMSAGMRGERASRRVDASLAARDFSDQCRRMPVSDHPGEAPYDPSGLLATLTGHPRAARGITRVMRTSVTDTLCWLLPGVVNVSAVRWLYGSCSFLFKAGPMWVKKLDRGVAEQRTYSAAMPAALMVAVWVELLTRYDAAHPDAPRGHHALARAPGPPTPSDYLRERRQTWGSAVTFLFEKHNVPPETVCMIRTVMTDAVRTSVGDPGDEAWGGWALLAGLEAMHQHRDVLPEPGRPDAWRLRRHRARAAEAGIAFQFGRVFMVTLAEGLLEAAERPP